MLEVETNVPISLVLLSHVSFLLPSFYIPSHDDQGVMCSTPQRMVMVLVAINFTTNSLHRTLVGTLQNR